ncbi:hypothetical protein OM076_42285 [Solirubrobacter ginsenosidimutans]|uniref:SHOCT domain-containing protein n=1 Tax=Solirubrobacter ginsenosidimutans TaxID=490573 RepID=A0A9X3S4S3_9ACTN|nr:hypothetical protein [Solirubrobacter ginsenosidimutans]MDA0166965.1 hypothetical protein [Solirubrobacter ginsenosidimutans]
MRTLPRIAVGFVVFAGGLTFLVYGIAQAITTGSCGSSSNGLSYGPACPSGMGPMILLMILGTFAALIGAGVASVRSSRGGVTVLGGVGRFIAALIVAVLAGVVLGFVDLHSDDTRPGLEIVAAVVVPLLLFAVPAIGIVPARKIKPATAPVVEGPIAWQTPAPKPAATTTANAQDIATRLKQLEQLRASGLLDEAAYKERRTQILAEL